MTWYKYGSISGTIPGNGNWIRNTGKTSPIYFGRSVRCLAGLPGDILPSSYTSVEVYIAWRAHRAIFCLPRALRSRCTLLGGSTGRYFAFLVHFGRGVRCLAGAPGNILPAAKILVRPYGLYSSYRFYTVGVYQDRPQAVSPGKPAMHSHSTGNGMSATSPQGGTRGRGAIPPGKPFPLSPSPVHGIMYSSNQL